MFRKLQSENGASLSFALLLFLVCAVVGSVILTSGTVASGRLSRLREMDKRYYSVNSAAYLIRDIMDGKIIHGFHEIDKDGKILGEVEIKGDGGDDEEEDLFVNLMKEATEYLIQNQEASNPWHTFSLSGKVNDKDLSQLETTAKAEFDPLNRRVIFYISNNSKDNKYVVKLNVDIDFYQRQETITKTVTVDDEDKEVEQYFVYTTTTWKGGDIQLAEDI